MEKEISSIRPWENMEVSTVVPTSTLSSILMTSFLKSARQPVLKIGLTTIGIDFGKMVKMMPVKMYRRLWRLYCELC